MRLLEKGNKDLKNLLIFTHSLKVVLDSQSRKEVM